jgi:hypothetical protein
MLFIFLMLMSCKGVAEPDLGSRDNEKKVNLGAKDHENQRGSDAAAEDTNPALSHMFLPGEELISASTKGDINLVKKLIDEGADISLANYEHGSTALMFAAQQGHVNILSELIKAGADVNQLNKRNGCTALMFASASRRISAAKILLKAGAEIDIVNHNQETALSLAEENEDESMQDLISLYQPY